MMMFYKTSEMEMFVQQMMTTNFFIRVFVLLFEVTSQ